MSDELIGRKCAVIAHRGLNKYAPQNTIPAFQKSFELGFNNFETDIHSTKDNKLVICHDYKINNVSDGIGKIADYTLDILKTYDFGSYFSDSYKNLRIATLEDLLELVKRETNSGIINIEIKKPKNGDTSIVKRLINIVKSFDLTDRLLISSFDTQLLYLAKLYSNDCRTAILTPKVVDIIKYSLIMPVKTAKEIGAYAIHPIYTSVNKEKINFAHKFGLKVCPWTVNKKNDIIKCIKSGADGIITDQPELCRETINKMELSKYTGELL